MQKRENISPLFRTKNVLTDQLLLPIRQEFLFIYNESETLRLTQIDHNKNTARLIESHYG